MNTAYSVRQSLQGALQDYVRESGFQNVRTEDIVRELVCALASYSEEGTPLFPEVYVILSHTSLATLSPGSQRVILGLAPFEGEEVPRILKDAANLAREGWSIYITNEGDYSGKIEFGLFRSLKIAVASSSEEQMRGIGATQPIILVRNRGRLVVELLNSQGKIFTVALTSAVAAPSELSSHVQSFCKALSPDSNGDDFAQFQPYASRFLEGVLQHCHGTLLAVAPLGILTNRPPTLSDGVWLAQPLQWLRTHATARTNNTADALSDLQAIESLLEGMIDCDGLVVFSDDGSLCGFRVFLQPTEEELDELSLSGGGRRRTYNLMRLRLGRAFSSVLFRSQDGLTLCEGLE